MCAGCGRGLSAKGVGRQDKQLNTYDWLADVPGNAESTDLVEVQFKNTRKGYYHNVNNLDLQKGDTVAVEANPGHDIGVVTLTGKLVKLQIRRPTLSLLMILSVFTVLPSLLIWRNIMRLRAVSTTQ